LHLQQHHLSERLTTDLIFKLPTELWHIIARFLPLASRAAMILASRQWLTILGAQPWSMLQLPEYRKQRLAFLNLIDCELPDHVLCHRCAIYHTRPSVYAGHPEWQLKMHGVYYATLAERVLLPFYVVQMAIRANKLGPRFGNPELQTMSWGHCYRLDASPTSTMLGYDGWSHSWSYAIVDGKFLIRFDSARYVDMNTDIYDFHSGEGGRLRIERTITRCRHLRSGLDKVCQCAVSHIQPDVQPTLPCDKCRPLRICYACATEYLVRVERSGDAHVLTVSRWSDLGDGLDPTSQEWDMTSWYAYRGEHLGQPPTVRSRFELSFGRDVSDEAFIVISSVELCDPWYYGIP